MKTADIIEELMIDAMEVDDWKDEELQRLIRLLKSYGKNISLSKLITASVQYGYNEGWRDAGGM